jgi:FG-GAP-like repeat
VGPNSARWFVNTNPRLLADLTGDGYADIIGFGDAGVYIALSNGDGTFSYQPC